MVSFSQPQRINPYNNNSLSSQGGDYLRRVARSAPKADFRKGIGLGVPSAILGAPGDLSQLAASLPGQSIFDYAQMLNLLPPDKEKVKGYLEGLLNPQINDQEAYDTGSGLIADLLSPAAVLKGPQTVKRAIDYAVDQPGVFDGVGEVLMGGALGQKRFQNNIFVGESGAPIKRSRDLERAQELERTGSTKDYIWRETGWGRGVDGQWRTELDDSAATVTIPERPFSGDITEVLKHPEFDVTKNYFKPNPEQGLSGTRLPPVRLDMPDSNTAKGNEQGSFNRAENLITLQPERWYAGDGKFETVENPTKTKSILLHELQHKAQELDTFARGGNPARAVIEANLYYGNKITKIEQKLGRSTDDLLQEQSKLRMEYQQLADVDNVLHYENITQPRFLFNTGEYYKHSDDISREFGKMPARQPARGEWLEKAGRYIADKKRAKFNARDWNFEDRLQEARQDRKALKNAMRRKQYALDKLPRKEMFELQRLRIRHKELRGHIMDTLGTAERNKLDFDTYQRLAGEVEARNVQKRMNFSADERRQTPPGRTQDIEDEDQIIVRE